LGKIGLKDYKQEILITVEDEGSGISPELFEVLFKKTYKLTIADESKNRTLFLSYYG